MRASKEPELIIGISCEKCKTGVMEDWKPNNKDNNLFVTLPEIMRSASEVRKPRRDNVRKKKQGKRKR
jgi:hypothetical protein